MFLQLFDSQITRAILLIARNMLLCMQFIYLKLLSQIDVDRQ